MNILQKRQLTKQEFLSNLIKVAVALLILGLTWEVQFPNDIVNADNSIEYSAFHYLFNLGYLALAFLYVAMTISKSISIEGDKASYDFLEESETEAKNKFISTIRWTVFSVFLLVLINNVFNGVTNVYNTSVVYNNEYKSNQQGLKTFYDNMWKTYSMKDGIKIDNKETFLQVANLVMDARKDGEQLASKLLVENQSVPFDQFSLFYADLSRFIESNRSVIQKYEERAQNIAMKHNTFLETYPNLIYNLISQRPLIKYQSAFSSPTTEKVFETRNEGITPAKILGLN